MNHEEPYSKQLDSVNNSQVFKEPNGEEWLQFEEDLIKLSNILKNEERELTTLQVPAEETRKNLKIVF